MKSSLLQTEGNTFSVFVYDEVWISADIRVLRIGDVFSDEDIIELVELGRILRTIRSRLVAEGKMTDTRSMN